VRAKLGVAAICLMTMLVFGGTGVFASWAIGTMLYDAARAREWTEVPAEVEGGGYRYRFAGREYRSERLGLMRVGAEDNIDTWHGDMRDRLASAAKEQRPITVYVNPEDPSQAVIDRDIRWKLVLFLTPFALAFGGVGVGALYVMQRVLRGTPEEEAPPQARPARVVSSDMRTAVVGTWLFAFFWNALAMPVAFLFVPDALRQGEWLALVVLIFPLVGVMLLWWAIGSTISYVKRGGATLSLATAQPRAGAALQGSIAFARGVSAGDAFRVQLECFKTDRTGDETRRDKIWTREAAVQAVGSAQPRVDFRFEVPAGLPATSDNPYGPVSHAWRIEARPAGQRMGAAYGFDVAIGPAAPQDDAAALASPARPVPEEVRKMLERLGVKTTDARAREALAQLKPEERQALAKYAGWVPSMKKIVIAIVFIVVAIQVAPFIGHIVHLVTAMGGDWQ
jgi:hypothetical protein